MTKGQTHRDSSGHGEKEMALEYVRNAPIMYMQIVTRRSHFPLSDGKRLKKFDDTLHPPGFEKGPHLPAGKYHLV